MVCRIACCESRSLFSRLVFSGLIISVTDSSRENVELTSKKRRRRHDSKLTVTERTHIANIVPAACVRASFSLQSTVGAGVYHEIIHPSHLVAHQAVVLILRRACDRPTVVRLVAFDPSVRQRGVEITFVIVKLIVS